MSNLYVPGGQSRSQDDHLIYTRTGVTPGQRWQAHRKAASELISAPPADKPAVAAQIAKENADLLKLREVQPGTVQMSNFIANFSLQYANDAFIGEMIMPALNVNLMAGTFPTYDERNHMDATDDDLVEGRAEANEVSDGRGTQTYACVGRALSNVVLVETLLNQQAPLDEMVDLMEVPTELLALKRDARIAAIVTTAGNYDATNRTSVAAGVRWDEPNGRPINDILNAIKSCWRGRGATKLVCATNIDVWNVLRQHKDLLALMGMNDRGLLPTAAFAAFFGFDEVLVSETRKDTANIGATASYDYVWGKFFWVGRVSASPGKRNACFGLTPRFMGFKTFQWFDPKAGLFGSYHGKVATSETHKIVASKTAHLISTPIN